MKLKKLEILCFICVYHYLQSSKLRKYIYVNFRLFLNNQSKMLYCKTILPACMC